VYRTGHQGINLLLFAPVLAALDATGHTVLGVLGTVIVFVTASLPDVDVKLPLVEHRGITHTVWAAVVVGIAVGIPVYLLGERLATAAPELAVYSPTVLGAYAGGVLTVSVLGHLLGDFLTPMGIRPFEPLSSRSYTLDVCPAASTIANWSLFGVGIAAVAGTVYLLRSV
jgi:inner membrane protein